MFNILLIIAGILEYILLGIAPKVSSRTCASIVASDCATGQLPKYLLGRNSYRGRLHQRLHRVLSATKVGGHLGLVLGHDTPELSRCPGHYPFVNTSRPTREG